MPVKSKAQARALFAKKVITSKNKDEWLPNGMSDLPEYAGDQTDAQPMPPMPPMGMARKFVKPATPKKTPKLAPKPVKPAPKKKAPVGVKGRAPSGSKPKKK
jgi:hypothetical protein